MPVSNKYTVMNRNDHKNDEMLLDIDLTNNFIENQIIEKYL